MNRNETFSSQETHTVSMDMVRSSIDVQVCDTEDIQLLISGDDESVNLLHLEWADGTLRLAMPMRDRVPNLISTAWMQIMLRLPRDWKGGMDLKSQSGSVSVRDFSGTDLIISTTSGPVRVENVQCITSDIHVISGIVFLKKTQAEEIKLTTVTGNILLSEIAATRIHLSTVSGNSEINLTAPFEQFSGNSVSGDTHLFAPMNEVNARLTSITGRILTRNISIQEAGPELHFNSVTGNLEIVGDLTHTNNKNQEV